MSRNNKERSGAKTSAGSQSPQATMANPMDFVAPTEYVELPSMGNGYMQGHPLHNQETIEIKFMEIFIVLKLLVLTALQLHHMILI